MPSTSALPHATPDQACMSVQWCAGWAQNRLSAGTHLAQFGLWDAAQGGDGLQEALHPGRPPEEHHAAVHACAAAAGSSLVRLQPPTPHQGALSNALHGLPGCADARPRQASPDWRPWLGTHRCQEQCWEAALHCPQVHRQRQEAMGQAHTPERPSPASSAVSLPQMTRSLPLNLASGRLKVGLMIMVSLSIHRNQSVSGYSCKAGPTGVHEAACF